MERGKYRLTDEEWSVVKELVVLSKKRQHLFAEREIVDMTLWCASVKRPQSRYPEAWGDHRSVKQALLSFVRTGCFDAVVACLRARWPERFGRFSFEYFAKFPRSGLPTSATIAGAAKLQSVAKTGAYRLTREEIKALRPVLRSNKWRRMRRPSDPRKVIEGGLFLLRTNSSIDMIPEAFGDRAAFKRGLSFAVYNGLWQDAINALSADSLRGLKVDRFDALKRVKKENELARHRTKQRGQPRQLHS